MLRSCARCTAPPRRLRPKTLRRTRMSRPNHAAQLSRRGVLAGTGALVISIGASLPREAFAEAAEGAVAVRPALVPTELSSYVSIDAKGHVTAYFGKIDGGQGLYNAIGQMVAD